MNSTSAYWWIALVEDNIVLSRLFGIKFMCSTDVSMCDCDYVLETSELVDST